MNATDFIRRQLGTTGWAPINLEAAQILCPEVGRDHQTFTACQRSPDGLPRAFPGAALYSAQVPGIGEILVLSRGSSFLAERMDWLGLPASSVVDLMPAVRPSGPRVPAPRSVSAQRPDQRLDRLRQLADEEPPAHDCERRREILAARMELAGMESAAA